MHNSQTNPESIQEGPVPCTMTLEEFLENDLEGYEYIKGELVPRAAAAIVHGEIGSNVHFLLASHVHESKLGRLYIVETTFFPLLTCEDTLTGEDVVEGFTCPVAQLFE